MSEKLKCWLLGGGILALLSGGITFGVNRANLANRLDTNDVAHTLIETKIDYTSKKLSTIDERTIRIEENIKYILGDHTIVGTGTGVANKK